MFGTQPGNTTIGVAVPTFTVKVEDVFGNVVTSDASTVTVSLGSGPAALGGTLTAKASSGIASFSAVYGNTAGNYTLAVADGNLTGATSNQFIVANATASITVTPPTNQTAVIGISRFFPLGNFKESGCTPDYTATVNWGDGKANTVIGNITAAENLPNEAHAYTSLGNDTVTITVTDSAGHTSNAGKFIVNVGPVIPCTISGTVYNDLNAEGKFYTGETGLAGVTVYIDTNKDGKLDGNETSVVTDANGNYSFTGLTTGTTYEVREVLPTNYVLTAPTAGYFSLSPANGQNLTGENFFDALATGSISGEVFNDANGNGLLDPRRSRPGLVQGLH